MQFVRVPIVAGAVVLSILLAPPALAGGGGGGAGVACPAFAPERTDVVVLRDFCFDPIGATAEPGATLTVRNDGEQPHTFTAVDGLFDTGILAPGESTAVEVPSDASGVLAIYCTLHADRAGNGMAGTLNLSSPTEGTTGNASPLGMLLAGTLVAGAAAGTAGGALLRRRREDQRDRSREPVSVPTSKP